MKLALTVSLLAVLALAGCTGDDDDDNGPGDDAIFDVAKADELAHDALPRPADLPGDGWEVVARDDFDDDDDDDDDDGPDFFALAGEEASCSDIADLATLGDILGSEDDGDDFAGRAKVEFERFVSQETVPSTVEVEIEIKESVSDAQGGWAIARSVLQSSDTGECIVALMSRMMAEDASVEGLDVTLETRDALADAPQDGVALAFAMNMEVADIISIDAVMGLYMWPYANATVQVLVLGDEEDLTPDVVAEIIEAVDDAVVAAAE